MSEGEYSLQYSAFRLPHSGVPWFPATGRVDSGGPAGAFVIGLQPAYYLLKGLLVLGIAIVVVGGERPAELAVTGRRVQVGGSGSVGE